MKIVDESRALTVMMVASLYYLIILLIFNENILFKNLGYTLLDIYNPYPIFNFLTGNGRFDDFVGAFSRDLPSAQSSYIISPLMIFITNILKGHEYYSLITYLLLSASLWIYGIFNIIKNNYIRIFILFSYPICFAFFRANSEFIACGFLLISLAYLCNFINSNYRYKLSILFLCLAISFKPTVFLFIILFPLKKIIQNYRIIAFFVLVNLCFIFFGKSGYNSYVTEFLGGLKLYKFDYIIGSGGTLFNNSFYAVVKLVNLIFLDKCDSIDCFHNESVYLADWYSYFSSFSLILFSLLAFLVSDMLLKIGLLCFATVMFPHISCDYRILYFLTFAIFILGCNYDYNNKIILKRFQYIFYLIILFILPKHYFYFGFFRNYGEFFTPQSIINPLIGFIIMIILFDLFLIDYNKKSTV